MPRDTFEAHSPWQAAYLLVNGAAFLRAYCTERGRVTYVFDNAEDRAWQLSLQWYNNQAPVDGVEFMKAFKSMQTAKNVALKNHLGSPEDYAIRTAQ